MKHVITMLSIAVAAGLGAGAESQAQGTAQPSPSIAAAAPAASGAHATKVRRARHRLRTPGRLASPTGGTPEASARTPGGPPPGTPNGLTIPIPSVGK